jgi:hypothetical protein
MWFIAQQKRRKGTVGLKNEVWLCNDEKQGMLLTVEQKGPKGIAGLKYKVPTGAK